MKTAARQELERVARKLAALIDRDLADERPDVCIHAMLDNAVTALALVCKTPLPRVLEMVADIHESASQHGSVSIVDSDGRKERIR